MPRWSDDESNDATWSEEETGYVNLDEILNLIELRRSLQEEFLTEEEKHGSS